MNTSTRVNLQAIEAALEAAGHAFEDVITDEALDAASEAFSRVKKALDACAALIEAEPTSSDPKQQARIDAAVETLRSLDFDICEDCGEFKVGTIQRSDYTDHPTLCTYCHQQRTDELIAEQENEEPSDWEWEQEQSRDYWS